MNCPHIIIGGVGGSGTRVIAMILASMGLNIGDDINESFDNQTFTLLFKKYQILDISNDGFNKLFDIFTKSFNKKDYTIDEIKLIDAQPNIFRSIHPKDWLKERALNLKKPFVEPQIIINLRKKYNLNIENIKTNKPTHLNQSNIYGFKEPNSHIILDRLISINKCSQFKYIHVMRNGLDMAFSSNQNQVKFWRNIFNISNTDIKTNIHYISLKYWVYVHKKILEIQKILGKERFLLINFDKMCIKPNKWLKIICKFVGVSTRCKVGLKYLIEKPSSIGRYKSEDLSIFDPADVDFVKQMGF